MQYYWTGVFVLVALFFSFTPYHLLIVYTWYFCKFHLKDMKTNLLIPLFLSSLIGSWCVTPKFREWGEQMVRSCWHFPPLHQGGVLMTWHAPCQLQRFKRSFQMEGLVLTWMRHDSIWILCVIPVSPSTCAHCEIIHLQRTVLTWESRRRKPFLPSSRTYFYVHWCQLLSECISVSKVYVCVSCTCLWQQI